MRKCIIYLMTLVVVSVSSTAFAAPPDKAGQSVSSGPRRHLANIVFAGLAGAVLGLSTLSFYGRPQDRLSNIAVGFAIGVIGGTMYSTYKAAAEPREFYGLDPSIPQLEASSVSRDVAQAEVNSPRLGYSFSF